MSGPVDRKIQVITQAFKKNTHRGVDLRSVDFTTWKKQNVIAPEPLTVLRAGKDGYGNDFVVCKPEDPFCDEIKFIHVKYVKGLVKGKEIDEVGLIGITAIDADYKPRRGNSTAHHLHFEVWKNKKPMEPVAYFKHRGIAFDYSWSHA